MGYKQLILVRGDLNMSAGKMAAQCSHASMAFLTNKIRHNTIKDYKNRYFAYEHIGLSDKPQYYRRPDLNQWAQEARERGERCFFAEPVDPSNPYGPLHLCEPAYEYFSKFSLENDLYEKWLDAEFTKIVLKAKNKNHLMKAVDIAEELGLKEGIDFFLIKDNCHTELEPEETIDGIGRTLTCIGFKPLPTEIANQISKKYQLYK